MGFDTHAGTRGVGQLRAGLMVRWVNKTAASRFRRTGKMRGSRRTSRPVRTVREMARLVFVCVFTARFPSN
jgi:hypothetical protein